MILMLLLAFSEHCLPDCASVKKGNFYFYHTTSGKSYFISRNDSIQTEIDIETKDTCYLRVNWKTACSFELNYIRATQAVSEELGTTGKSTIVLVEISKVTKDYYVSTASIPADNFRGAPDTLWRKKR